MKRERSRLMAWFYFACGVPQVAWGIFQFATMKSHWSFGLWIVAGILFIIGGLVFWKTSKIVY